MQDQKERPKVDQTQTEPSGKGLPADCTCVSNPYASLPPELRPHPKNSMGGLRRVTCPNCGLKYWTNRQSDLCVDCEKSGATNSKTNQDAGG
jgi:hypothetical protein